MKETDLIFLTKKLEHYVELDLENKLAKFDMTPSQLRILFYVNRSENKVRQMDLESHLSLSKSTISGLVNRLIAKNYLIRKKEKTSIYLLLSDKAKDLIKEMIASHDETIEILTSGLSKEEVDSFIKTINILINNMKGEIKDVE